MIWLGIFAQEKTFKRQNQRASARRVFYTPVEAIDDALALTNIHVIHYEVKIVRKTIRGGAAETGACTCRERNKY